ncbi:MAG: hypothetical protein J1F09_06255 [Oscillospiraceae bacterium]|nr:hypothetical protein [Oscillospiraceae bacterium]
MKKLLSTAAALIMAASLTACSFGSPGNSKDRYSSAADEYKSYYDNAKSQIESNKSNIESNKSDNSKNSESTPTVSTGYITIDDYTFTFQNTVYSGTYEGYAVARKPNGSGKFNGTDTRGNSINAYCEKWGPTGLNGAGGVTIEPADTSTGFKTMVLKGEFVDSVMSGKGTMVMYSTDEVAASGGLLVTTVNGQFSDNSPAGKVEMIAQFSGDFAAKNGYNRMVYTGSWKGNNIETPYTVKYYNGNTLVDEDVVE